ncbi:MAG TPA: peptidoglycan-binding domain-containing protein [Acidobacteriaceae bacterium]|nr:peptidoglycan-binding domain-containing protein [Acidobacteriaceae bacterium]
MSKIALPLTTMFPPPRTRVPAAAGILILALSLAGAAFASSQTSAAKTHDKRVSHLTTKRSKATSHRASLHHTSYSRTAHRRRSRHHRPAVLGQRTMDQQRAIEIQQALIQAHYLSGSPTGRWDSDTQAAMVKYQTDNGWQSKITPDSRALIKLGLGPQRDAGEYSSNPVGISKTPTASTDTVRSMATSEIPLTSNN